MSWLLWIIVMAIIVAFIFYLLHVPMPEGLDSKEQSFYRFTFYFINLYFRLMRFPSTFIAFLLLLPNSTVHNFTHSLFIQLECIKIFPVTNDSAWQQGPDKKLKQTFSHIPVSSPVGGNFQLDSNKGADEEDLEGINFYPDESMYWSVTDGIAQDFVSPRKNSMTTLKIHEVFPPEQINHQEMEQDESIVPHGKST